MYVCMCVYTHTHTHIIYIYMPDVTKSIYLAGLLFLNYHLLLHVMLAEISYFLLKITTYLMCWAKSKDLFVYQSSSKCTSYCFTQHSV